MVHYEKGFNSVIVTTTTTTTTNICENFDLPIGSEVPMGYSTHTQT